MNPEMRNLSAEQFVAGMGSKGLDLFDHFHCGVAVLDHERRFLFYNRQFNSFLCEQTGLELNQHDLIGQSLPIQSLWEAEPATDETSWKLETPGGKYGLSAVRLSEDSSLMQLHPEASYILQLNLLSSRRELEAELAAAITQSNRSEADKLELLTSFSHEFRTPLNAVMGFGNLLLEEGDKSPRQREYIEGIIGAGSHLLKLVNEILVLSKADHDISELELSNENVDIGELISETVAMLQPLLDRADVSLIQSGPSARLICDRTRLKQVLLNLVSNAVKYNKPGGEVVVNCLAIGNRCAGIEVRDTGIGIPAEMTETIFNPFKRLLQGKSISEGSGLGLMLSRRLVNLMGGQIKVASQPGSGSVFTVDFNLDAQCEGSAGFNRQSVAWLGSDAEKAGLAKRFLETRPGVSVCHIADTVIDGAEKLSIDADLVFVDGASLEQHDANALDQLKALLPARNLIGIESRSSGLQRDALLEIGVVKRLPSNLNPVNLLDVYDRVLQSTREPAA
jgi:signal transduction histidine kinase